MLDPTLARDVIVTVREVTGGGELRALLQLRRSIYAADYPREMAKVPLISDYDREARHYGVFLPGPEGALIGGMRLVLRSGAGACLPSEEAFDVSSLGADTGRADGEIGRFFIAGSHRHGLVFPGMAIAGLAASIHARVRLLLYSCGVDLAHAYQRFSGARHRIERPTRAVIHSEGFAFPRESTAVVADLAAPPDDIAPVLTRAVTELTRHGELRFARGELLGLVRVSSGLAKERRAS